MNKKKVIATVFVSLALLALIFSMLSSVAVVQATSICKDLTTCYTSGPNSGDCIVTGHLYYACDGSCTATSSQDDCSTSVIAPVSNSFSQCSSATPACKNLENCYTSGPQSGDCVITGHLYYACDGSCTATSSKDCSTSAECSSSSGSTTLSLRILQGNTTWTNTAGDCLVMNNGCKSIVYVGGSTNEKNSFSNHLNNGGGGCLTLGVCSGSSSSSGGSGSGISSTGVLGYTVDSSGCINYCTIGGSISSSKISLPFSSDTVSTGSVTVDGITVNSAPTSVNPQQ